MQLWAQHIHVYAHKHIVVKLNAQALANASTDEVKEFYRMCKGLDMRGFTESSKRWFSKLKVESDIAGLHSEKLPLNVWLKKGWTKDQIMNKGKCRFVAILPVFNISMAITTGLG